MSFNHLHLLNEVEPWLVTRTPLLNRTLGPIIKPRGLGNAFFPPFLYLLSGMTSSPVVLGGQGHLPHQPSPSRRGCGGLRSLHPDRQQVSTLTPKVLGAPAAHWALAPARVRPTCCGGTVCDWDSGLVRAIGTAPSSPGCRQPALPRAAPRGHSTSLSWLQPPPRPGQSPEQATDSHGRATAPPWPDLSRSASTWPCSMWV